MDSTTKPEFSEAQALSLLRYAAARHGFRIDPSGTSGRYHLKSAIGHFIVDGVALSLTEISQRLDDAKKPVRIRLSPGSATARVPGIVTGTRPGWTL